MSNKDDIELKSNEYTKEELEEAQAEIEKKSISEDLRADGYEENDSFLNKKIGVLVLVLVTRGIQKSKNLLLSSDNRWCPYL